MQSALDSELPTEERFEESFPTLPPEVLTQIFDLIVRECSLHVRLRRGQRPKRCANTTPALHRRMIGHHIADPWDFNDIYRPSAIVVRWPYSVLLTCRQFHALAGPIAYGCTHFHFNEVDTLEAFAESIGNNIRFLRYVHIRTWWNKDILKNAKSAFRALSTASRLRKLYFTFGPAFWRATSTRKRDLLWKLIDSSKPLMLSLRQSYQARGLKCNILDFLTVDHFAELPRGPFGPEPFPSQRPHYGFYSIHFRWAERHASLQRTFRSLMAKSFEAEEEEPVAK